MATGRASMPPDQSGGAAPTRAAELGERSGSGVALWARLAESLRRRLAEGELEGRFPTETELAADYAVSRATVREAVRRLRAEGLVEARQGAGTFVVRRRLDEPVLGRLGLAQVIESAGLAEESRILDVASAVAGPRAAELLGCRPQDDVLRIERLRVAGNEVIALDRSILLLPREVRRRVLRASFAHGSLYDVVEREANLRLDAGREVVRSVACAPSDRKLLELAPGEGVLELERIAYAASVPVEWRRTLLKGSHYVFGTSWGAPPPAPPGFSPGP